MSAKHVKGYTIIGIRQLQDGVGKSPRALTCLTAGVPSLRGRNTREHIVI